MRLHSLILTLFLLSVLFVACKRADKLVVEEPLSLTKVPAGFPEIPFTDENPFSEQKWELGKKLFYDKALSVDYSISCASCHKAALAFSDNIAKSLGSGGRVGRRNAPSLANVAYHPYYTREGGLPTLEMQILVPIQEHDEFNFNIVEIAERLRQVPEYVNMSKEIFNRDIDAYVITRAIATFERTLISGNSAYDKYVNGDNTVLTPAAIRGKELFFSSRTNCGTCHSGFNFTNYSFQNNGLYLQYADMGRQRLTGDSSDNALFKVPSLRNIALTAPYMHDGSFTTLEQVIEHYNSGGLNHPNKSGLIKPMSLSQQEKSDLIAFLQSLTDYEFITNKNFYNEE